MKKILIVDDEPNIVMSLEYTFKKNNYEVFIARDGQETLDILKTNFPDVIILDIMMPMVDGFATLEQIRKDDNLKHTKVLFLSAKNKASDIEKGLALGADAYMTKPFTIKKVVEQLIEFVGGLLPGDGAGKAPGDGGEQDKNQRQAKTQTQAAEQIHWSPRV